MSYNKRQIGGYFSKTKIIKVSKDEIPTITPPAENIMQYQDPQTGKQVKVKPQKEEKEEDEKPKRKKYLPGERLLRKLTNTKEPDDRIKRIVASIKKAYSENTIIKDDA